MTPNEALAKVMDPLRAAYDGLNPRERFLVGLLGAVFAAIAVLLPLYLAMDSIARMETENQELAAVLNELNDAADTLRRQQVERDEALARYARRAPSLGTFIEGHAQRAGNIQFREVTEQPPETIGEFQRRQVRVSLSNVGLRPVVKMLAEIERSDYPVAIERIQVDHTREGDSYQFQIAVSAYDRPNAGEDGEGGAAPGGTKAKTKRTTARAGRSGR